MGGGILIKDENIRITITIPKKLHKKLLKESEYEDRSISNLVCRILKKYYKFKIDDEE